MKNKLPPLSPEQHAIVARIRDGRNILVTGSAGTGKSRLLKELSTIYKGELPVCGSTGIAAVQVGGLTLHSWAGLGLGEGSAEQIAGEILQRQGAALGRIKKAKRLALDEVSMIHGELFEKMDEVFRIVRKNPAPFGGVQLILFGDFLQLPPVARGKPQAFAFQSAAWERAAIETGMLTQVFRQQDADFSTALNCIRMGEVSEETERMLRSRYQVSDPKPGTRPVIVHSHNADVDRENDSLLGGLVGKIEEYVARDSGQAGALANLQKNCLAPGVLRLRKGAQVMLLKNIDPEIGLANGSIGIVEDFVPSNRRPVIRFQNGVRWESEKESWTVKNGEELLAERVQHPLRLAWAITAHKSQGMTLDKIRVHLAKVFEYGQAYVALSRARTLDGLFIESTKKGCIKAHPEAVKFYQTSR